MSVSSLLRPRGNAQYYTDGFRQSIEDHLSYLKEQGKELIALTERTREMYRGDLYGLLIEHNVPAHHLWVTMRCNGYHSPSDFHGQEPVIKLIRPEAITEVFNAYYASQGRI